MTAKRRYEVLPGHHGTRIRVNVRGSEVLRIPRLNRGSAFTWEEREKLGLIGQLPTGVTPLEAQLHRAYAQYQRAETDLAKFAYLSSLRDRNTVLFYRLLSEHLEEMMPIVYTPTIGQAIVEFSQWYQRLHGVFLSIDRPEDIERSLSHTGRNPDDVDLVIVTDSEGILGIGDQGVGGIQICLGKKSLYTAAAGIDPNRMIAVVLDVGTDNLALLSDPLYLGRRHARERGERYDEFIAAFVEGVSNTFPYAMIHWEDFGAANAHRILDTYRATTCSFNDDVQGTAAVVAAAILSGVGSLGQRLSDQRIVVHGAGTAGVGISDLLVEMMVAEGTPPDEARSRFWGLGSQGLLTTALGDRIRPFQRPYARPAEEVADWEPVTGRNIGLAEVVHNVHPTVLIGTSGQPGAFTRDIVSEMAAHVDRPVIMPLSNPTSLIEATPADLIEWTDGRVLIATGSPFKPVTHEGTRYNIAQANNAFVFPGIGLGVAVSRATRVTDGMIAAAARAVARLADPSRRGASLLPRVSELRHVSATVAISVAKEAEQEGRHPRAGQPRPAGVRRHGTPVYPELIIDDDDESDDQDR